jgi:hypothetical protein
VMRRRRDPNPTPLPLGEMMSNQIMRSTVSISPLATHARRQRRPAAGKAIRGFCLACVGAINGRGGFDCGTAVPSDTMPEQGRQACATALGYLFTGGEK